MTQEPPQEQPLTLDKRFNKETILSLWPWVVAVAVALVIVCLYVGLEAPCYWSDFNYYEWATRFSIGQITTNLQAYPFVILASVAMQHNLFFTVPLVPIMALLGGNRYAYVASTTIVYLLPLAYIIARLAKELVVKPGLPTSLAFLLILIMPVLWAPPLRGYPDCGAALTLLISLLLYLGDRSCKNPRRGAAIGFLLALTVLLRRYFAFACVALVATLLVDQVCQIIQTARQSPGGEPGQARDPALVKKTKTLLALIGAGVLTMICLGFPFLQNLTRLNFGELYQAYHVTPASGVAYFFSCFGLFTLLLSASGFLIAWRQGLVDRAKTLFVLCFFILAQGLWILVPDELGTHYTLYFSPLVALGLVLFFNVLVNLPISKSKKTALLLSTLLLLALNFILSLAPVSFVDKIDKIGLTPFRPGMLSFPDQEGQWPALFFSAGYPPYSRGDLDTLKTIVSVLRPHYIHEMIIAKTADQNHASDQSPLARRGQVCVASCSNTLNGDTLRNVERSMFGLHNDKILVQELPVVDSKDSYPLETLLACQYLLVPSQNQYFILPQGQKILASIKACFDQRWPLAADFRALPTIFVLDGGLKVTVFERVRATTEATAALTLSRMKAFVGVEPGSQPRWLTTGQMSQICYDKKRSQWQFRPGLYRPGFFCEEDRYLLYEGDLPESFTLSGKIETSPEAPATTLIAQLLGEDGRLLDRVKLAVTPFGQATVPFIHDFGSLHIPGAPRAKYLVLIVDNAPQAVFVGADVAVADLKLEARERP